MRTRFFKALHVVAFSLLAVVTAAVGAPDVAKATAAREAQKLFSDEMAFCVSGQSVQGRRVCEKEARAAHSQNLRGALTDGNSNNPDYSQNMQQRCQALAAAERSGCMMRIGGKVAPGAVVVVPGSEAPLQATTPPRQ